MHYYSLWLTRCSFCVCSSRHDLMVAFNLSSHCAGSFLRAVFRGFLWQPSQLAALGKVSKKNVFIWDFVPNIGPHPPTAHVWDSTKWKIKVKFILLFRLFRAFYFFEKMRNFSDKIPKFQNLWGLKASWNGQIWPPHLCITCFRTFLDVCSKNNWMVIFTKKFGTLDPPLDPPTHSLGQSPK